MTDKQLRKLSRGELLELLLAQTRESEQLRRELEETKRKLEDRQLQVQNAGSVAQAAMQLHNIFESAQDAADQYLENIHSRLENQEEELNRLEQESAARAAQMIANAEQQRDTMLAQAKEDAEAYWQAASAKVKELLGQHEGVREQLAMSVAQE